MGPLVMNNKQDKCFYLHIYYSCIQQYTSINRSIIIIFIHLYTCNNLARDQEAKGMYDNENYFLENKTI